MAPWRTVSRWGQFQAKPFHLLFGLLAVVCAVISATLADGAALLAGWVVLGAAGAIWMGFVGWALWSRRRGAQDRRGSST